MKISPEKMIEIMGLNSAHRWAVKACTKRIGWGNWESSDYEISQDDVDAIMQALTYDLRAEVRPAEGDANMFGVSAADEHRHDVEALEDARSCMADMFRRLGYHV